MSKKVWTAEQVAEMPDWQFMEFFNIIHYGEFMASLTQNLKSMARYNQIMERIALPEMNRRREAGVKF